MNRLVVGVIGHVDHGKTALVRALTGTDTDRLAEEKARGMSLALGFAHFRAGPDCEIDLIDMPGHERFVRTMVSGATGIDAALLVVAANEGIKPQTLEHVDIAALLGLRRAIVAVSKCDLVPPNEARQIADDATALLALMGIETLPPVMTSATQERGIEDLRRSLVRLAADHRPRRDDGHCFLPIDRAFSMAGHGPVVTGTLRNAVLRAGDRLELFPSRREVRLRAMQVHGHGVEAAFPGQRVALNLRDVAITDLHSGMALAAPGTLAPAGWLTLAIRSTEGAPVLRNGRRLRALFGTLELDVALRLLDRDELSPGESAYAQLRCSEPVVLPVGEHVILRIASPSRTVAGGRLLEAGDRRLTRHSPPIIDRLRLLQAGTPAEIMAAEIERRGGRGTNVRDLSALTGLAETSVRALLETLPAVAAQSGLVAPNDHLDRLLAQIPALLALHSEGLTLDRIRLSAPGTGAGILDLALSRLLTAGVIVKRGSRYGIPRPAADRTRAQGETALAGSIAETLRLGGLTPPRPAEIVVDAASRRAVDRLLREGTVVRAVDRAKRKEILFHRDAVAEARRRLTPLFGHGGLLVTEICSALGISRKFAMPLLDHLDTIGFTRRIGDRRLPKVNVRESR